MICHYEDSLPYQVPLCSPDVYLSIKALSNKPIGNGVPCYPHVDSNTITLLVTDRITLILNTNEYKQVYGFGCGACLRLSSPNPLQLFQPYLLQKCFYTTNLLCPIYFGGNVITALIISIGHIFSSPGVTFSCRIKVLRISQGK